MFTGIIEATGTIKKIEQIQGDVRLTIQSATLDFGDVKLGDSIASNGICLTVVAVGSDWYSVDVSRETLSKTALRHWQIGTQLNLEKAMLPTTRFGGHIVSGHVDTVGTIGVLRQDSRSIYVEITIPNEFAKYVATKGSVTVDGISLTTNLVQANVLSLNIIPHTAQVTNISKHWRVGQMVNIEVDVLARYLERLLVGQATNHESPQGLSMAFLAEHGFVKP